MNNKMKNFTQVSLDDLAGLRGLGASSILVYMALRIYGGKDSTAWPSQDRIASDIGIASVTVRKAIKKLKERGYILEMTRQGKTKTYQVVTKRITDPIVSPIRLDHQTDPIVSPDRSDRIKTPIQTDPLIYKEYIKENIQTIENSTQLKTDQIYVIEEIKMTEENEEESREEIKYPVLISFEEAQKMNALFSAKKGTSNEVYVDELDLLFVKLWERHSVTQNWVAERIPTEDFRKIRSKFESIQIKKALKDLDVYLDGKTGSNDKWCGLRWFERLESWIMRRDDTWTARDATRLSKAIHIAPADVHEYNKRIQQDKEQQQEQAARDMSGSRAREMWARFVIDHPEQEDRVNAIQAARVFADFGLTEEIKKDPDLVDFALIVSAHMDLASLGIIK